MNELPIYVLDTIERETKLYGIKNLVTNLSNKMNQLKKFKP
jgi:hypothetical protein